VVEFKTERDMEDGLRLHDSMFSNSYGETRISVTLPTDDSKRGRSGSRSRSPRRRSRSRDQSPRRRSPSPRDGGRGRSDSRDRRSRSAEKNDRGAEDEPKNVD
jgi:hypothetical protein